MQFDKFCLIYSKKAKRCKKKNIPYISKRTIVKILGVLPQTVLNEIKSGIVKTKRKVNNKVKYKDAYSPIYGYIYIYIWQIVWKAVTNQNMTALKPS